MWRQCSTRQKERPTAAHTKVHREAHATHTRKIEGLPPQMRSEGFRRGFRRHLDGRSSGSGGRRHRRNGGQAPLHTAALHASRHAIRLRAASTPSAPSSTPLELVEPQGGQVRQARHRRQVLPLPDKDQRVCMHLLARVLCGILCACARRRACAAQVCRHPTITRVRGPARSALVAHASTGINAHRHTSKATLREASQSSKRAQSSKLLR